jgi:hypothetical protein
VHQRIERSTLCALFVCLVAGASSSCSHAATASDRPTPAPTTRAGAAQLASEVELPATFTPETRLAGLDYAPCAGRCWRSTDTPREALTTLATAMRATGLVVTAACASTTSTTGQPLPNANKDEVCTAKAGSKSWTILLSAAPDIRRGVITTTGSTIILGIQLANTRHVLKACQRGQACVTFTSPPGT